MHRKSSNTSNATKALKLCRHKAREELDLFQLYLRRGAQGSGNTKSVNKLQETLFVGASPELLDMVNSPQKCICFDFRGVGLSLLRTFALVLGTPSF